MPYEPNPDEIGALWNKMSAKGPYMTGVVNGQKIVIFAARKTSDKSPDWRILKSKPRPESSEDIGF